MEALAITSQETSSDRNVSVFASWIRPSNRSGEYLYNISIKVSQRAPYSGIMEDSRDVNFNDTLDNNTTFMFTGLASAEYTIAVTAVNIKTGRPSPQVTEMNTTVTIGIIHTYSIIMVYNF